MTDEEWTKFDAGFASAELLAVVNRIDELRGYLNDGDRHAPPEIRTDALKLQMLSARVLNEGARSKAPEMFDLAEDLESQAGNMIDHLEEIQQILARLIEFRPDDDGTNV
jgi:hypothetical protein